MPPRMMILRFFAKIYHFTPEQVGRLPLAAYRWFPVIEQAEARAAEVKQRAERAAALHESRRRG